ncbi:SH3 domain-containing protein [Streptomyces sp. NPDC006632]|uniref:SH3 domain-containing protein n=1 Tax=unclassified Streptomyces TaxID=2593676 RepID=UPI002E1D1C0F
MNKHAVRTGLIGLSAAVGLVTATAGVGHAQPLTTARPAAAALPASGYSVVPYENVNVRKLPRKNGAYLATLTAGRTYTAYCWTLGDTVTDHGITNNIWIGFADGYSSAVYFKGNEYANLPVSARC